MSTFKRIESIKSTATRLGHRRSRGADPSCLIAMATHGMSGMRRWLIGSVASKVVQGAAIRCCCATDGTPIEPRLIELKTIFVPLDGSGLGGSACLTRFALPSS